MESSKGYNSPKVCIFIAVFPNIVIILCTKYNYNEEKIQICGQTRYIALCQQSQSNLPPGIKSSTTRQKAISNHSKTSKRPRNYKLHPIPITKKDTRHRKFRKPQLRIPSVMYPSKPFRAKLLFSSSSRQELPSRR